MNNPQHVRLQNIRDFTVQIRQSETNEIVGTGFAIAPNGRILTCAHVIEEAIPKGGKRGGLILKAWRKLKGEKPDCEDGETQRPEVMVYFPQVQMKELRQKRARVVARFKQYEDDVVLLELVNGQNFPLAVEKLAVLGTAESSARHEFQSYGYQSLGDFHAGWALGRILGGVEKPAGQNLFGDPLELECQQIDHGISGAAVLDVERNLVVGIIHKTYFAPQNGKNRDSAWAVDASVLREAPFELVLRTEALELASGPQAGTNAPEVSGGTVRKNPGILWNGAPALLPEWVGRADLLQALHGDWASPTSRITGLVGFGGEGKTSLARHWVEDLLVHSPEGKPAGVFWWRFSENGNVDQFFEAALIFLLGPASSQTERLSSNAKAHLIAATLSLGRYLFVLDGLEEMQYAEGDQHGLLQRADLRDFLSYFASPSHESFCLLASRLPLFDLMAYTTYTHRDVSRLDDADGRALLVNLGAKGTNEELDRVVKEWDGYALALSLVGAQMATRYGAGTESIVAPSQKGGRYDRIQQILTSYAALLSEKERVFLIALSCFRTPIEGTFVAAVAMEAGETNDFFGPLEGLDDTELHDIVKHLADCRILRTDGASHKCALHTLIRQHFQMVAKSIDEQAIQELHLQIGTYYLSVAKKDPNPTLAGMAPVIEAIHHMVCAKEFVEALKIYKEYIYDMGNTLQWKLGAYQTEVQLLQEYYPHGDLSRDPQLPDPRQQRFILNSTGVCLMYLGRLQEAEALIHRKNAIALKLADDVNLCVGYHNLTELSSYLGNLNEGEKQGRESVRLSKKATEYPLMESTSFAYLGWVLHLKGDLTESRSSFLAAARRDNSNGGDERLLLSNRGVFFADHLLRSGDEEYARMIVKENLKWCERNRWVQDVSRSYRLLGDLERRNGKLQRARQHYDKALKLARNMTFYPALFDALLARGRLAVKDLKDAATALTDLNEALSLAQEHGYRIYQADAHVALAWARYSEGDHAAALSAAKTALTMSAEMGYHWGKLDADEVLSSLEGGPGENR
jgi:tetratricopeptide (TPR) repeat protein